MASCSPTTPSSRHASRRRLRDVRGGPRALPRIAADRVPQRRHLRAARALGRGRARGGGRARRGARPKRLAVLRADDCAAGGGSSGLRGARRRRSGAGGAHELHHRGLRDHRPRPRPRAGRRGRDDDRRALRAPGPARREPRDGCRRRARPRRDSRRRHVADAPDRVLARALDDRSGAPARRARSRDRHSGVGRRRPGGRRDPDHGRRLRLPHDLGPEVALRAGLDRGARRPRPRAAPGHIPEQLRAARIRA